MDWSLALASQDIASVIRTFPGEAASEAGRRPEPGATLAWALEVDSRDAGRALRTLRQYHQENRRWNLAQVVGGPGVFPFQWAVLLWCFLMVVVQTAADAPGSRLPRVGTFDTARFVTGDWWRPITATFLHANLDHLVSNLTSGFIVLGLAIGRFGIGPALLASLLAGSLANLAAWNLRGGDYVGLGSSGVVMAGLGMLAFSLLAEFREGKIPFPVVTRGLLGGIALFLLLGTSPQSDVLAHAAGFTCGIGSAVLHALVPPRLRQRDAFALATAALFLITGIVPWLAALR